jgi:hypothetical protein
VIFAPGQSRNSSSVEMVTIDARDRQTAQDRATTRWRLAARLKPNRELGGRVQASAGRSGQGYAPMTEKTIDLDQRVMVQKATDPRVAIGHVRLTSIRDVARCIKCAK